MNIEWTEGISRVPDKCDEVLVFHKKFNTCYLLTGKELIETCSQFNSINNVKWTVFSIEKLRYLVNTGQYILPIGTELK